MTQYLVYWKTFWDDSVDGEARTEPDWHTDSATFADTVQRDDTIWIVVTGGVGAPNEWRLLQRFVVSQVKPSPADRGPGRFEISGGKEGNDLFDLDMQPDFTAILWLLNFSTNNPISVKRRKIGQSLQTHGFRTLADGDVLLLEGYANRLERT